MTRWVLLLRAVNLGRTNKLAMTDLTALLVDLGHGEVKTYLNSGNATFISSKRSAKALASAVQEGLRDRLGLDVRACVRTSSDLADVLAGLPELGGYVVVAVLFDEPTPAGLRAATEVDWLPDQLVVGPGVLYLSYAEALHTSPMQNARLEKLLGVSATGRTPATLRKLLAR